MKAKKPGGRGASGKSGIFEMPPFRMPHKPFGLELAICAACGAAALYGITTLIRWTRPKP